MPREKPLSKEMLRWAPDEATAAKWLAALEAAGPVNVRDAVMATGRMGADGVVVGIENLHIKKGFMQAWLREQEDAAARWANIMWWFTLVAAVAAVIAALPVVVGWFE